MDSTCVREGVYGDPRNDVVRELHRLEGRHDLSDRDRAAETRFVGRSQWKAPIPSERCPLEETSFVKRSRRKVEVCTVCTK